MVGPLLAALACLPLAVQGRKEEVLRDFETERERVLVENGQRHLDYGLELRKKGLTLPAAAQLVAAVDASLGKNENAAFVLHLMRSLEEGFWKRKVEAPAPARLEAYEKKAAKLRQEDLEARVGLVRLAERKGLEGRALEELRNLLVELEQPLEFDERGALVLAGVRLGNDLAASVKAEAITIDGRLYARDVFLLRVPGVREIHEAASPELLVRSTASREEAERLHAAARQALPVLFASLGVRPARRLQLVALHRRADYEAYLDIAGLSSHRAASGFADRVAATAVLCGEGMAPESVLGIALHELTHLYQLSVSPAVLPSWYLEGSAEALGGPGTFTFDGATLVTGGKLAPERLAEVRAQPLALADLLAGDALTLLARDPVEARRYYAQAWAFVRFLEQGAGPEVAERLERWRAACSGALLGADLDRPYARDPAASQALFLELFQPDLERLERDFGAWLANQ